MRFDFNSIYKFNKFVQIVSFFPGRVARFERNKLKIKALTNIKRGKYTKVKI